jgi:predicted Zn-dependent peptidase
MISSFEKEETEIPASTVVKEYVLDNGMTVWLNEDHNQPKIFGAVVVKAGAKDSPNTGIAHYFEHIMFKGTDKIGTVDYAAEKVYLDKIAEKYDLLANTKNDINRNEIQQEINELSILASDYVIPNEFDKLITRYGGSNLNAATSYDYTVYHNLFLPQYIEQWAELNSERLINPVFRMFQSELETVYEEKNRRDDMMFNQAIEKALELYFYPHPYAYSIIGSAENLKNPSLSKMRSFFKKYYVASNMGLILSGDFDTKSTLPILKKAFSRIPKGEKPAQYIVNVPPFRAREKHSVKIPIPIMHVMALGFRGVPANHPDRMALNIAISILSNTNGTGYLDQLMVQRKLMAAMAGGETFNEAGMLGFIIIPGIMNTYRQAEKLVCKQINRLKRGDFSDEMFESLKQEQIRKYTSSLEDIDSRSQIMIRLFTQNKKWDSYLTELRKMDSFTRDDMIKVINKYLNNNYMIVCKKTGKYIKEYLAKPGFSPIIPKHTNSSSRYAKKMESLPVQEVKIRYLDFDKDIQTIPLTPKATLYVTENPVNSIFSLKLSFEIGMLEFPMLKYLPGYLSLLGTGKYSSNEFRTKLQVLGTLMHFEITDNRFLIKISGFDKYLEETLILLNDFMQNVKYDRKKLKTIIHNEKVGKKAFFKSSTDVAEALFEYVRYGINSRFLTQPSLKEVKKLKENELIELFHDIKKIKCNFHYCGTKEASFVVGKLKEHVFLEDITKESNIPYYREPLIYDKPLIFFYDMNDIYQNIVYGYQVNGAMPTIEERCAAHLFTEYFGGGMSSLLFQEIREFRAYAYHTSGAVQLPAYCFPDKPASFVTFLATQADKTVDAMTVLDSVVQNMPVHPEKIEPVIKSIINDTNNGYPSFRNISTKIVKSIQNGYKDDPNKILLQKVKNMTIDDVIKFHKTYIKNKITVYAIVGNSMKINMDRLSSFGNIIRIQRSDFYR